ncbi:MAG: glycoside hydrolase family 28 protein, partial [Chitinophagaceae bacterium]
MKRTWLSIILFCLVIALTIYFPGNAQTKQSSRISMDWIKQVGAKQAPRGERIFKVNDYGAVNDGKTMDTKFIQKAIDACAIAGGGVVTFDTGEYVTGSIFVKSGVTLRIDKGVKISGSQHIDDYPIINTRVAGIEMKWPAA